MSDAVVAAAARSTSTRPAFLSPRLLALVLGLGFVLASRLLLSTWLPAPAGDFDLLYDAAARLLRGDTAYPFGSPWLPYPLPAVVLVAPFTVLPPELARPVFDVLVGWIFAFALWQCRGPYALLALPSGAYLFALMYGHTTPLMVAASLIPALGFLLAVRPNTSVGVWVARPSWSAVLGATGFVALTVALFPSWLAEWWMTFLPADYSAWAPPILRPFGAVLLLAALRWNRPEGRLLLATAFLPQTALPYELVPLALIPADRREMMVYLVGSWIAAMAATGTLQLNGAPEWLTTSWAMTLCAGYVPMLYLVLRRPGRKGGPWIGKERRRPHRLPDDQLEMKIKAEDGYFTATVTHRPTQQSITQTGPTREAAARKAHDKLAAILARTSRLAKKELVEPQSPKE